MTTTIDQAKIAVSDVTMGDLARANVVWLDSSYTKGELTSICRNLGISKFSKYTKPGLINFMLEIAEPERIRLQEAIAVEELNFDDYRVQQEAVKREMAQADSPCSVGRLKALAQTYKGKIDPADYVKALHSSFKLRNYADVTIAKDKGREVYHNLPKLADDKDLPLFDADVLKAVQMEWKKSVAHIHRAIRADQTRKINLLSYESKLTMTTNSTMEVLQWAKENLYNRRRPKYQGLAFALLTGRRQIEVFGQSTYEVKDGFMYCERLAKQSNIERAVGHIVTLIDPAELVRFINHERAFKRNLTRRQVKNYSSTYSTIFPDYLKERGLQSFKDSRDFYSGFCLNAFVAINTPDPDKLTMHTMCHSNKTVTDSYRKFKAFPENYNFDLFHKYLEFQRNKALAG